jgi:TolA-binding protein
LNQADKAAEEYRQLTDEYPQFSELDAAIYRLAWLEHRAGDADEARRLWQQLRRDHAASKLATDATLRLAEDALAHRQFDETSKLLSEITQPESPVEVRPHALALAARVAMAQGRWSDVETPLATLDELLADSPDEKMALSAAFWRAEAAFRLGKYAEAAERLQGLLDSPEIREQPWAGTATLRLAQTLAQLKKWPESREVAQSILRDFPALEEQYEADYLIGRALVAEAQLDEARTMFAKVVAAEHAADSETAVMAQFMIAETYFHQQHFATALAEYRRTLEDDRFPRWQAAALLQAGKCHEALGEWTAAVSAYEQLVRGFSDSPLASEARTRATNAQTHARAAAALKK